MTENKSERCFVVRARDNGTGTMIITIPQGIVGLLGILANDLLEIKLKKMRVKK